jgi:hypothetical protein
VYDSVKLFLHFCLGPQSPFLVSAAVSFFSFFSKIIWHIAMLSPKAKFFQFGTSLQEIYFIALPNGALNWTKEITRGKCKLNWEALGRPTHLCSLACSTQKTLQGPSLKVAMVRVSGAQQAHLATRLTWGFSTQPLAHYHHHREWKDFTVLGSPLAKMVKSPKA